MTGRKNGLKVTLLISFFIAALTVGLFPYLAGNDADKAYDEPEGGLSGSRTSVTMQSLIIDAAGYYFKANADIQQILYIVEMQDSGIDTGVFNTVMDYTMENVKKARDTYFQLTQKAANTPYNHAVLELLNKFPYDDYRLENGLNQAVMDEVESYLKNGDVTGVFKNFFDRLSQINDMLMKLKAVIYTDKDASITIALKLNETLSDMSLFGSYVARVFRSI